MRNVTKDGWRECKPESFGVTVSASTEIVEVPIDKIKVNKSHRKCSPELLEVLIQSIAIEGLKTPLQVATRLEGFGLVAGRHRLEALKALGKRTVPCTVLDHDAADLWRASENLMRLELTALERAEARCEWVAKMEKFYTPEERGSKTGRPKKSDVQIAISNPAFGLTEAARRKAFQRDKKIASLSPDIKREIVKSQLDNDPSALATIAAGGSREESLKLIKKLNRQKLVKPPRRKKSIAHEPSSKSGMLQVQEELDFGVSELFRAYDKSAFQRVWEKAKIWDRHEFALRYLKITTLDGELDWEDDEQDHQDDHEYEPDVRNLPTRSFGLVGRRRRIDGWRSARKN